MPQDSRRRGALKDALRLESGCDYCKIGTFGPLSDGVLHLCRSGLHANQNRATDVGGTIAYGKIAVVTTK